ncbi:MAG: hypothetical protein H7062_13900 [Candidatus Saccharimonas sp.]|nr:hypothetical protein [Planctomycetaceae bacterium]
MSARILVTSGPDRGRDFAVGTTAIRVGPGFNSDIRLTDPSLQGDVLIEFQQGVYHVTNLHRTAVYLQGTPLPPGQRRVWYDEAELQPTAQTSLRLTRGSVEKPPPPASSNVAYWVLGAVVVLFGIGLLLSAPVPKSPVRRRPMVELVTDLETLEGNKPDLKLDTDWRQLRAGLAAGRLASLQQRRQSTDEYRAAAQACKRLLERWKTKLPTAPDEVKLLEETKLFLEREQIRLGTSGRNG